MSKWEARDMPDQSGRVAIVTGANSGLGYETVLALARKNARIVMACRNLEKGEAALNQVRQYTPIADITLMQLDLAVLASVREFVEAFTTAYDRLDMLFNNAGVMARPYTQTKDGFELQMGVNHFAHFALTGLLLDTLFATPGSRVVTVSSMAARLTTIDLDDLDYNNDYDRYDAYYRTKLANLLFMLELHRRLSSANAPTISVAAHPGYTNTDLQFNAVDASGSFFEGAIYAFTNRFIAQSAKMGVLPQLYAATAPDVKGGQYYGPSFFSVRGYPQLEDLSAKARDAADAAKLWDISEARTGVTYDITQRV
jgi:protochlorophyllide reductase